MAGTLIIIFLFIQKSDPVSDCHILQPLAIALKSATNLTAMALSLALLKLAKTTEDKTPIMEMTTRSSIKVKPFLV